MVEVVECFLGECSEEDVLLCQVHHPACEVIDHPHRLTSLPLVVFGLLCLLHSLEALDLQVHPLVLDHHPSICEDHQECDVPRLDFHLHMYSVGTLVDFTIDQDYLEC